MRPFFLSRMPWKEKDDYIEQNPLIVAQVKVFKK